MATIIKRGDGWQARIRRIGFPVQSNTFEYKADAEAWGRAQEAKMDAGVWRDDRLARTTSLAHLLEEYETVRVPTLRSAAIEKYRIQRLREDLGAYSLASLSPRVLAAWRDERLEMGVAPSTVNRELTSLSAVYSWARKDRFIPCENPVQGIRRPKDPRPRDRRLLPGEEQRLLAAMVPGDRQPNGTIARGTRNPSLLPLVRLALETAMRRGEILSLCWEHVDLRTRVAHLPLTKNGDARDVPLSTAATDVLKKLQSKRASIGRGRVFGTTESAMKQAFERAVASARKTYAEECAASRRRPDPRMLTDLHFHDLRHEATSRLAAKLPNLIELASVTGHRDLRSLKRYYHPKATDLAKKLG